MFTPFFRCLKYLYQCTLQTLHGLQFKFGWTHTAITVCLEIYFVEFQTAQEDSDLEGPNTSTQCRPSTIPSSSTRSDSADVIVQDAIEMGPEICKSY